VEQQKDNAAARRLVNGMMAVLIERAREELARV
jgi:hypothetical protein